jgi:cofilin
MNAFQELKLRKTFKYIVYTLSPDNKAIIVDKKSADTDYETFLGDLPENECRYAVYDVEYDSEEGGKRNKLVFFNWYVRYLVVLWPFTYPESSQGSRWC